MKKAGAEFTYILYCRLENEVYCILNPFEVVLSILFPPFVRHIHTKKPFQNEIYTISRVILMFQFFKVIIVGSLY